MPDYPYQPIDGSFARLEDTFIEARQRQRIADMQRGICHPIYFLNPQKFDSGTELNDMNAKLRDVENKMRNNCIAQFREEAEQLSNRELLKEIYVMLKTQTI